MEYDFKKIDDTFNKYIENKEIPGALILIKKDNKDLYKKSFGYSNIELKQELSFDDTFRLMSMTKVVTTIGLMKLYDKGLFSLDDNLSKFIPEFKDMNVVSDDRYSFNGITKFKFIYRFLTFNLNKVKAKKAEREITIRDLLSHSSGLEQGMIGLFQMKRNNFLRDSFDTVIKEYSKYPLDFNPKEGTSYSPIAGFDLLVRVIEVISNKNAIDYFNNEVFEPLKMNHSTFKKSEALKNNLVSLYKRNKDKLIDVSNTKEDMDSLIKIKEPYVSGSGGLYTTIEDFSNLTSMLANDGVFNNNVFLKKETVDLIHTEGQLNHLEPDPGMVWGLGVKIRQDKAKYKLNTNEGTYGWSGAFGTHFFIDPSLKLEAIMFSQRSDAGGSGFYVSHEFEKLVFDIINKS